MANTKAAQMRAVSRNQVITEYKNGERLPLDLILRYMRWYDDEVDRTMIKMRLHVINEEEPETVGEARLLWAHMIDMRDKAMECAKEAIPFTSSRLTAVTVTSKDIRDVAKDLVNDAMTAKEAALAYSATLNAEQFEQQTVNA